MPPYTTLVVHCAVEVELHQTRGARNTQWNEITVTRTRHCKVHHVAADAVIVTACYRPLTYDTLSFGLWHIIRVLLSRCDMIWACTLLRKKLSQSDHSSVYTINVEEHLTRFSYYSM